MRTCVKPGCDRPASVARGQMRCGAHEGQRRRAVWTEADWESHRARLRDRRNRHIAAGLCANCNDHQLPGVTYCAKHLQYLRDWNARQRKATA